MKGGTHDGMHTIGRTLRHTYPIRLRQETSKQHHTSKKPPTTRRCVLSQQLHTVGWDTIATGRSRHPPQPTIFLHCFPLKPSLVALPAARPAPAPALCASICPPPAFSRCITFLSSLDSMAAAAARSPLAPSTPLTNSVNRFAAAAPTAVAALLLCALLCLLLLLLPRGVEGAPRNPFGRRAAGNRVYMIRSCWGSVAAVGVVAILLSSVDSVLGETGITGVSVHVPNTARV